MGSKFSTVTAIMDLILRFYLLLFVVTPCTAVYRNTEEQLRHDLFQNYSSTARPVKNSSHAVDVTAGFAISQILYLDETNQVLHLAGWINIVWKDDFLTWNPADYGGVKAITLDYNAAWTPDIVLYNSANELFSDAWHSFAGLRATHDGGVQWFPGGRFETVCSMDVTYYPQDRQDCEIIITQWVSDSEQVMLKQDGIGLTTENMSRNGEWDVVGTSTKTVMWSYTVENNDSSDGSYDVHAVIMTLHMRRKSKYIVTYVQIPCMATSALAAVSFIIPPQFAEKVSTAFSVLVSFTVFMLITVQSLPRTSDYTPILSIYMMFQMFSIASVMLFGAIVVNLYVYQGDGLMSEDTRRKFIRRFGPLVIVKLPEHLMDHKKIKKEDIDLSRKHSSFSDISGYTEAIKYGLKPRPEVVEIKGDHDTMVKEWQTIAHIVDRLFLGVWVVSNLAAFAAILVLL